MTDQMVLKTQQWLNRTYRSKAGFGAHPKRGWVAGVARRSRGRRRGLHMMGVLTLPIRKTTTCPTVPSPRPI